MRGVRDIAVGGNFARAGANNARRKLWIASSEHQRIEAVAEKIAENAGVVLVVFVPGKIMLRRPRNLRRFAEPTFPIEV